MKEDLIRIEEEFNSEIDSVKTKEELETVRVKFLGRKGEMTKVMRGMKDLSNEEKPVMGKLANELRDKITKKIAEQEEVLENLELERRLVEEKIDITLPGKEVEVGSPHPLNIVIDELEDIFIGMGFNIVDGPDIEWTKYNFDYLNMPEDHASRDFTETFYYSDKEGKEVCLRTQTSPVQVRTLLREGVPLRVVSPGRTYRADEIDATHSPVFHQIEGLVVDKNITMGDLKGTLELFAKKLFGDDVKTRFRPHQFYFTEPSAEMDISCFNCGGEGCNVCGNTGWIEVLGCGMVHPNLLKATGIDPEEYSGFAFGAGLDRIAMLRYGINDLRLLFENDLRFIKQFK